MSKAFASQGDLAEKRETFDELAPGVFALTAEGDPNSGVVIGDDSVLVIDARATPVMAKELVAHIRKVTDKPIRHVLLTHYHAVRVLGVAGYEERVNVIASDVTRGMIVERGRQDMDSEIQRFPRLFRAKETIPGLTWPNVVFHQRDDALAGLARGPDHPRRPRPHRAATRSPGCPRRRCCSRATWSSTAPRPIAATRTSATGPARSTGSRRSSRRRWCRAAARR